jgi:transposase InsO family protein
VRRGVGVVPPRLDLRLSGRRLCQRAEAAAATVVDQFTRECLAIEVASSFNAREIIRVLEILIAQQATPQCLRSDNVPEFCRSGRAAVAGW